MNDTKRGEIVIYKTAKNEVDLKVRLEKETIWLDTRQMAFLFGTQRPAIVKHINNIYKSAELEAKATCSKTEQVAKDGRLRKINLYNLDVIISVGYRVNSVQATQFRIWATKTLQQYLIRGYALNQKYLLETREKFEQLQTAIGFLKEKSKKGSFAGQESELINLLATYAKTLTTLDKYDHGEINETKGSKSKFVLNYGKCLCIISELKKKLIQKNEANDMFGHEKDGSLEGIITGLYQTFDGKELYPTIEDKASHILYLIIKDHPFSDGNKRSAAFLFVYFLDKSNYLYHKNGEKKINDNALTALALLVAESSPKEKKVMIKIIKNLISE